MKSLIHFLEAQNFLIKGHTKEQFTSSQDRLINKLLNIFKNDNKIHYKELHEKLKKAGFKIKLYSKYDILVDNKMRVKYYLDESSDMISDIIYISIHKQRIHKLGKETIIYLENNDSYAEDFLDGLGGAYSTEWYKYNDYKLAALRSGQSVEIENGYEYPEYSHSIWYAV